MPIKKQGQASSGKGTNGMPEVKRKKEKGTLYIRDSRTKYKWLIDGEHYSQFFHLFLFNARPVPMHKTLSRQLYSYPLPQKTKHHVTLCDKVFLFDFIIADVTQPIIGADFFAHFYLAPNHQDGCLVNLKSFESIQTDFTTDSQTTRMNFSEQKQDLFYQLLDEYPDLSTLSSESRNPNMAFVTLSQPNVDRSIRALENLLPTG